MKTSLIAGVSACALLAASAPTVAHAGQGEWALAGKVLTGVVAAGVVASALTPAPPAVVYQSYPAPVYAGPGSVAYYSAPPRAVYYSAPAPVVYSYPAPIVVAPYPVYYGRPFVPYRHYRRW